MLYLFQHEEKAFRVVMVFISSFIMIWRYHGVNMISSVVKHYNITYMKIVFFLSFFLFFLRFMILRQFLYFCSETQILKE